MPRRKLAARDILDQSGIGKEFVLVRDYDSTVVVVTHSERVAARAQRVIEMRDGKVAS